VNEPLALLLSSRGTIATQLAERLEALRYRMVAVADPVQLGPVAETEKPLVVLADLEGREELVARAVGQLRGQASTMHIPVIGFRRELEDAAQTALAARGFTVAASEAAILNHLPQLLEQALDVH
jgi:DNA-binding response OmpR family regulator